jgi:hypothetical protein
MNCETAAARSAAETTRRSQVAHARMRIRDFFLALSCEAPMNCETAAARGSVEPALRSHVAHARTRIRESFERFFGRRP